MEDDPALRTFYRSALMIGGYTVITAEDGLDALHRIEAERPDLIVLDLGLPRLSGRDVRRELAAHIFTEKIPIVVVTGDTGDLDRREFPCVLRKPVTPETLLESVDRCLR